MNFRSYEVKIRELLLEVFEDELTELHKAGFVHRHLKRQPTISELSYDNILLTKEG